MKILKIIKTAKVCAENSSRLRNDERLMKVCAENAPELRKSRPQMKVCAENAPKLRNDERLMTGGGLQVVETENKKAQLKFS